MWFALRTGKDSFPALWQHGIPRVRSWEDRETKETRWQIWASDPWNCHEEEAVNLSRNKRDDEGQLKVPARVCPVHLLIEHIRDEVAAGRMPIEAPLFRFKLPDDYVPGDGDVTQLTLSAGGFAGLLDDKKLPESEMARLKKLRVDFRSAWKQAAEAKCKYVFRVVDNAAPEAGIQIAIETSLLGDKMKEAIVARRDRLGKEDGNPILNPCAWRWTAHPKALEINKRYAAVELATEGKEARPLTEEIREAINRDPPPIDKLRAPGNPTTLRAQLEKAALMKLPWDRLFEKAEEAYSKLASDEADFPFGGEDEDDGDEKKEPAGRAPEVGRSEPAASSGRRRVAEPEPKEEPAGDPCDKCGAAMTATQTVCSSCGQKYELEPDEPAPKETAVEREKREQEGDEIAWARTGKKGKR